MYQTSALELKGRRQSRVAGYRHIGMTDILVWQNWHALVAGPTARKAATSAMEGHTAKGKRAYRGHTATGKQNNLAGVHWCPERQALIMFIMIWNQRLVAKKTGHAAHELARKLGKQTERPQLKSV